MVSSTLVLVALAAAATSARCGVLSAPTPLPLPPAAAVEQPPRQLPPPSQSFLSTLGTALAPVVGAIVGPLLSNFGQNLSTGSGAQAISQLQQAAIAAAAAHQQHQEDAQTSSSSPQPEVSATPSRPSSSPRPSELVATPAPSTNRPPMDAFVLDVPGKGPVLLLMPPTASADEQSAAIEQAKLQAAQILSVNEQPSQIGAVASLVGASPSPRPQATKPTSAGPLPVPVHAVSSSPAPSHDALEEGNDHGQQGGEEVAVADREEAGQDKSLTSAPSVGALQFSPQSLLERLFPEIM